MDAWQECNQLKTAALEKAASPEVAVSAITINRGYGHAHACTSGCTPDGLSAARRAN